VALYGLLSSLWVFLLQVVVTRLPGKHLFYYKFVTRSHVRHSLCKMSRLPNNSCMVLSGVLNCCGVLNVAVVVLGTRYLKWHYDWQAIHGLIRHTK
jgi:hypothetical protein